MGPTSLKWESWVQERDMTCPYVRKLYMFTHFQSFYWLLTPTVPPLPPWGSTALWACAQKGHSPQHFSFLIPTVTHCSLLIGSIYYKSAHHVYIFSPLPPLPYPLFLLPVSGITCPYLWTLERPLLQQLSQAYWTGPLLGTTSHLVGPPSSPNPPTGSEQVFCVL